jgi:hypothetical protein
MLRRFLVVAFTGLFCAPAHAATLQVGSKTLRACEGAWCGSAPIDCRSVQPFAGRTSAPAFARRVGRCAAEIDARLLSLPAP